LLDPSLRGSDHIFRLVRAATVCGATGKLCPAERARQLLEAIIEPGDRVAIEGDNQKQADFSPPPWRVWGCRCGISLSLTS
jgi:malonate decarboxylase alpha subunit